jgi:hypothetical protein
MTLTKEDVKAITLADGFVVAIDGKIAKLRLIKKSTRRKLGPFEAKTEDAEYSITCDIGSTQSACFVELYRSGAYDALARIVRPGDRLIFSARQNNNQYADACVILRGALKDSPSDSYAHLHCDELLVTVARMMKNGRERAIVRELVIDTSFTPDNTARALRPLSYSLV